MTSIFDACNVPTAFRGLISGTLTIPSFGADDEDGKNVAHRVENSAQGFLLERLDGAISMQDTTGTPPISRAITNVTSENFDDAIERDVDGYFTTPANSNTDHRLARIRPYRPILRRGAGTLFDRPDGDQHLSCHGCSLLGSLALRLVLWKWYAANDMDLFTGLGLRDRLTYRA